MTGSMTAVPRQGLRLLLMAGLLGGSASTGFMTLSAAPGEAAIIDGTGLGIPNGLNGLVTIDDASFVRARASSCATTPARRPLPTRSGFWCKAPAAISRSSTTT